MIGSFEFLKSKSFLFIKDAKHLYSWSKIILYLISHHTHAHTCTCTHTHTHSYSKENHYRVDRKYKIHQRNCACVNRPGPVCVQINHLLLCK